MAQQFEPSETGVANLALSHLRISTTIISLDSDNGKIAKELKRHFAIVRDGLQRQYQWNFCEHFAVVSAVTETPLAHFTHYCDLPPDCLFVRELIDCSESQWKVIGERRIAVKVKPPLTIRYSRRVVEVPYWDALFVNAFALHLALAACPVLAEDEGVKAELKEAAQQALMVAFPADSAEGIPDAIPDTNWVTCR